jgi:hypothetical protein
MATATKAAGFERECLICRKVTPHRVYAGEVSCTVCFPSDTLGHAENL